MIRLIGYFFGIGTVFFLIVAGAAALYLGNGEEEHRADPENISNQSDHMLATGLNS